jgi:hypothetical protein
MSKFLHSRGGKKQFFTTVFILLVTVSCNDDLLEVKRDAPKTPVETQNPFSLEITLKALENMGVSNPQARALAISLPPTHDYLKFTPNSEEELVELQNLGYELFQTPLDENVAQFEAANPGSVAEAPFGTFYTLKPVQYGFSLLAASTPKIQLSQVVLFDENAGDEYDGDEPVEPEPIPDPWEPTPEPGICYDQEVIPYSPISCIADAVRKKTERKKSAIHQATVQLLQAGVNLRELYNERMRLAGHEDEVEEVSANGRTQGYNPAGTILVNDNSINQNVALKNVVVKTRRWFKLDNTTTNVNGSFFINKSYRKKAHVILKFKNDHSTVRGISGILKVWEYVLPLEKEIGLFEGSALTNVQHTLAYNSNPDSKSALQWTAAHFINSLWDMRQFCAVQGLPNPPSNLNVWVSDKLTSGASAPMLRAITNSSQLVSAVQYLFPGTTSHILSAVKMFAPDITMRIQNNGTTTRSAENISSTFFHELAHSLHYAKVGNNYWAEEIAYTIANGGYGSKNTNGSGRPAVVEAWGFYVGSTFNRTKYNAYGPTVPLAVAIRDREGRTLENQRRDDTIPYAFDGTNSRGWIPAGLLHDCTDVGEPTSTGITDLASTYTMSMLFKGFTESATNVQALRANILSSNNNAQASSINTLVNSYGW